LRAHAKIDDLSHELMPQHHALPHRTLEFVNGEPELARVPDQVMHVVIVVQVRTTDPAGPHLDQHVTVTGRRDGDILHHDLLASHHGCAHGHEAKPRG
jgi:hypothetical protein